MLITNTKVYDLKETIIASGFPMKEKRPSTIEFDLQSNFDLNILNKDNKHYKRCLKLANTPSGSGHSNFMKGISVHYNLTCSAVFLIQYMRYNHQHITSSQSTMHRITKFDLDKVHSKYVDKHMLDRFKELVQIYIDNPSEENFSIMMDSSMKGLELTMRCATNYLQLKTMYNQRKNHKYYQWKIFCEWIKELPYSEFITG